MKRLFLVLLMVITLALGVATPVYAIDPPDSMSLKSIKVFRNLVEDGDVLVVFHSDWDFSDNYSDTPASASMMYRLYDTDGTSILAQDAPYVFPLFETNGYGNNIGSFYFNATDNMTWGQPYRLNIEGLPAFFSGSQSFNYTLTTADYTDKTTQEDNRDELYLYIMLLADRFNSLYGIDLKTSSDSGIVLSSYGERFFWGAIDGLLMCCPQLFFIQVYIPEVMEVEPYTMDLQDTYTDRLVGTDLENGFERIGEFMGGMSASFAQGVIFFIIIIAICVFVMRKGWPIELGMGASVLVGIFAALVVGSVMFTILMIGSLIAVMGIFYLLTFKRS